MSFAIRTAWPQDLDALAALAADCQADSERFCAYVSEDAQAIAADVRDVTGWAANTCVALDDNRNVIGWLLAETEAEMSRVWWWGPFLSNAQAELHDVIATVLFRASESAREKYDEREMAIDQRSVLLDRIARAQGMQPEEGSLMLSLPDLDGSRQDISIGVSEVAGLSVEHRSALAQLHDDLFPGTHSTGAALVNEAVFQQRPDRSLSAALLDEQVAGYVVTEAQNDGSLYIDYLGVAEAFRGRGIGRDLVLSALNGAAADRTHAHLTVREGNGAARALYRSVGFLEDRVLVPYRSGFSLDG